MNDNMAELVRLAKRGRRAEQSSKAWRRALEAIIVALIAAVWRGFFLMLGVGIIHDHWILSLPTIGYWYAVLVYMLLDLVFDITSRSKKASS